MSGHQGRLVAVDLGRTNCRLTDDRRTATVVRPSGVTVADPDGPARVVDLVRSGLQQLRQQLDDQPIHRLAIGAAGILGAPAATNEAVERLGAELPHAELMVTSDIVTAHAGALDDGPGVVLIAGTGAVALGVAADGRWHTADGHGALLDDAGSGFAIGRAGIKAALRHHDGRPGGSHKLALAARQIAPVDELVGTLQSARDAIRDIAAFAPTVATTAREGDAVAQQIFRDAADQLAATVLAAIQHTGMDAPRVAFRGPVTQQHDLIATRVKDRVATACPHVQWHDTGADALTGALSLLRHPDGIHRGLLVHRQPSIHASS